MSTLRTLARPYARAAFETAQAANAMDAWLNSLSTAADLVSDPECAQWIDDPRLGNDQRTGLFLPEGEESTGPVGRFISLLAENDRLPLLPEIAELFVELKAQAERTLEVKVRTAGPIEPAQEQMLIGALAKRFERAIVLNVEIDPELIGGAIIDTGDSVIDGSLRSRLTRLKAELQS